jgi:hypothetical protein
MARARARGVLRVEPNVRAEALETPSGATAEVSGDVIVVRDKGALVLRYDAATGTAEISVPSGDLRLVAGGRVVVSGAEVAIEATSRASVTAPEVVTRAGRIEVAAERIVERATDVYRTVDGLMHTRADRVRSVVKGLYQLMGGRISVRAEDDASLDGKRVLLG